jgi:hypothetical protein
MTQQDGNGSPVDAARGTKDRKDPATACRSSPENLHGSRSNWSSRWGWEIWRSRWTWWNWGSGKESLKFEIAIQNPQVNWYLNIFHMSNTTLNTITSSGWNMTHHPLEILKVTIYGEILKAAMTCIRPKACFGGVLFLLVFCYAASRASKGDIVYRKLQCIDSRWHDAGRLRIMTTTLLRCLRILSKWVESWYWSLSTSADICLPLSMQKTGHVGTTFFYRASEHVTTLAVQTSSIQVGIKETASEPPLNAT